MAGGPLGEGKDSLYPGGSFDPHGFGDDPNALAELKVKEVRNGRSAMISMLGYYVPAIVTDQGPVESWAAHVAEPFGTTFWDYADKLSMFSATSAWYGPDRVNVAGSLLCWFHP